MIHAIIYSYKGKETQRVVKSLLDNTVSDIFITVIDQHPLTREDKIAVQDNVKYVHMFWDRLDSPCKQKYEQIFVDLEDQPESIDYILMLGDDFVLSHSWDQKVIDFMSNKDIIVSGFGKTSVVQQDKYLLKADQIYSNNFNLSNYIDRNFIFAKHDTFTKLQYPQDVKYRGENEILSAWAFDMNIDVYSAPSFILEDDLGHRPIENLYTPFSIEHNYNEAISEIKERFAGWMKYHNIDSESLKPVPYQINDVPYNPYDLKMVEAGGERFYAQTRAIF